MKKRPSALLVFVLFFTVAILCNVILFREDALNTRFWVKEIGGSALLAAIWALMTAVQNATQNNYKQRQAAKLENNKLS